MAGTELLRIFEPSAVAAVVIAVVEDAERFALSRRRIRVAAASLDPPTSPLIQLRLSRRQMGRPSITVNDAVYG